MQTDFPSILVHKLWEKALQRYPTRLSVTPDEKTLLPIPFKKEFAIHERGNRYVFACFGEDPVYSAGSESSWKYLEDHSTIPLVALQGWFLNNGFLKEIDPVKGTATYSGKNVQWSKEDFKWKYLNHRMVHFESPSTSQASSRSPTPESVTQEPEHNLTSEEDDTAKVEDLLQRSEASITSSLQKLSSRPSTPVTQTSLLPQVSEPTRPVQGQISTPSISKGKAK